MSVHLQRFETPGWLSNTWLLASGPGGPALLVDGGAEPGPVLQAIRSHRFQLTHILLTHHHIDHCARTRAFKDAAAAQVVAHTREVSLFADGSLVDRPVEDGEEIECGDLKVRALHIPGHTAGQLAFYEERAGVFTGDTLFAGSVGGTMAPGHTDFEDLRRSLERLLSLPDDTPVHPGHRLSTSIGHERQNNPFLRVMTGQDPEGVSEATYAGRPVRLIVWARDYDGGHKAWVRFQEEDRDAVVPGSRVRRR